MAQQLEEAQPGNVGLDANQHLLDYLALTVFRRVQMVSLLYKAW